jgi:hypothetical protein
MLESNNSAQTVFIIWVPFDCVATIGAQSNPNDPLLREGYGSLMSNP